MIVMCTAAFVGGKKLWTAGELASALGTEIATDINYKHPAQPGQCLCGVDIEAMCLAAGATFERDDIGDYEIKVSE